MDATTRCRQTGQTTVEYLGLLVVVGAIVAALVLGHPGRVVADAMRHAICRIANDHNCGRPAPTPDATPALDAIQRKEQAAHDAVEQKIATLEADPDHDPAELAALHRLSDSTLFFFDPKTNHFAEVFGNLSTATNVAVVVPGSGQGVGNYFSKNKLRSWSNNLQAAAAQLGDDTATIAWMGYDTPDVDPVHLDLSAASRATSVPAGGSLADFIPELDADHRYHVTVVGHSYGTLVAAQATAQGMKVDDLVVVGSPGLGLVDQQTELDPFYGNASHLWAARAPDDMYAGSSWKDRVLPFLHPFALDPYDPANGFAEFRTNIDGNDVKISGHDGYFQGFSESLLNMAYIVSGRRDAVSQWGG